ncbi:hypothetical protein, partial [Pseudomonas lundensis]|uniref:hypothetical protein n=1 Tax=Pseudomonas lundensis TaxID=86185 RepID=UPI001CA400E7
YEVSSLAFEFSGKDTTLLGHLTPRYGEHSRLNECPVSLDHYRNHSGLFKRGPHESKTLLQNVKLKSSRNVLSLTPQLPASLS